MRTEQVYGYLNYDNGSTLCTASANILSRKSGDGEKAFYEMYMDGKDATITVGQDGKNYMWPTPTCRPYQMSFEHDYTARGLSSNQSIVIDGTTIWNVEHDNNGGHTEVSGVITNDAISNSTRNSSFQVKIHVGTTIAVMYVKELRMWFDFYRYDHEAKKSNDSRGVQSVDVLLAHDPVPVQIADAYHGDYVVYRAHLDPKARWKGWYADPEHTILVSTDVEYTVEATSDLVLYAYATKRQDVDFKVNGVWKEGIVLYEKRDGIWVEINKNEINGDVGYWLDRGD